jgi:hypothetical protein
MRNEIRIARKKIFVNDDSSSVEKRFAHGTGYKPTMREFFS